MGPLLAARPPAGVDNVPVVDPDGPTLLGTTRLVSLIFPLALPRPDAHVPRVY